ncbi:MAG TPA: hypothetical protein VFG50_01935, partial [Rhodothermales bacterium]|nr:hypothetical protein [Rhodothermales bacterium]
TAESQEVRVYQTDYLFYADGTNVYGAPGSTRRSNASWITYNPDYFVLPAGATANVAYSVTVPADAADTLSGSYWSIIMVEGIEKGSPESTIQPKEDRTQVGIRTALRFGVQITTNVGGDGNRKISFDNPSLQSADDGSRLLQVDLVNEGTLAVRPQVWVELYDEDGNDAGRIDGTSLRLYPGTSVRQRFSFGKELSGRYRALVFVDAGDDEVYGAEYTLDL